MDRPSPVSILLVTDQFLPVVGGTEVTTLREAKALRARGHPVRVLTLRHNPRWPRVEELEGVSVQRTGGFFWRGRLRVRFGLTWLAEALVWRELVRTRHTYDVVLVRQLGRLARPSALASLVTGKPLVVRIACASAPRDLEAMDPGAPVATVDGESPPSSAARPRRLALGGGDVDTLRRGQYLAPLTLWLLRAPWVRWLALSTDIRENLLETGCSEQQIIQLPNGVDTTAYLEVATRRAQRPPAAPGDMPTVVCPARLSHQKGQDVLLKAWRTVREQVPTARLILAGDGPQRLQLEHLAAELGIPDAIEFAGLIGDLRPLFAAADGFVLPSRYEGMPNALLEAMAAGMPCVATRVSGSEDIIIENESGLLVPPEDPQALASALVTILTQPQRASSLGREARARVVRSFDQRRLLDESLRFYSSLVSASDSSQRSATGRLRDAMRSQSAIAAPATADVGDAFGSPPTQATVAATRGSESD
jgi:glycosyltransferase involved in cell wall biosynthesis